MLRLWLGKASPRAETAIKTQAYLAYQPTCSFPDPYLHPQDDKTKKIHSPKAVYENLGSGGDGTLWDVPLKGTSLQNICTELPLILVLVLVSLLGQILLVLGLFLQDLDRLKQENTTKKERKSSPGLGYAFPSTNGVMCGLVTLGQALRINWG